MTTKQQPDPSNDHQTTPVHDHGVLFKYNRTQKQDLRDSIFGSSRQMTINTKKTRVENIKKTQRKRMANMEFSTSFFLIQISAQSTAGAKQLKMRMVAQVSNGKKNGCFFVKQFCGSTPTQCKEKSVHNSGGGAISDVRRQSTKRNDLGASVRETATMRGTAGCEPRCEAESVVMLILPVNGVLRNSC